MRSIRRHARSYRYGFLPVVGVLAVLSLAPAAIVTTGCATNATAQRKAFTSIADVAEGVSAAMKAFNALYQSGTVGEDARTKVLDAYKIYQKGALLAVSVGKDLGQDANALKIATDAAWPLLDLIATIKGGAK